MLATLKIVALGLIAFAFGTAMRRSLRKAHVQAYRRKDQPAHRFRRCIRCSHGCPCIPEGRCGSRSHQLPAYARNGSQRSRRYRYRCCGRYLHGCVSESVTPYRDRTDRRNITCAEVAKKPVKDYRRPCCVMRISRLIATRMTTEQMLPIIGKMDEVGYHAVECWGGATFDACLRFLKEDPWERLRKLRAWL